MSPPIGVHPENPKLFLFRGRPRVLICATEHYGSVLNRAFDFTRYLDEAADKRQTLTRLFLLFRELQTPRNPYSPCKPESPDYLAPWPRTGPGEALDGEPKYDLDQWNDEYFARLRRFLTLASERNIVVEVTLFSNTYADHIWALNPLRAANNLQGVGRVEWQEYTSLRDQALVERQKAYVRQIVREVNAFDNLYFEVCNEPGGGYPDHATLAEIDAWQEEIARTVREEEATLANCHLIFWQQAFNYLPRFEQAFDESFANPAFDVVNVHPLPDLMYRGRRYQMGRFMGKELRLADVRDFCLATYAEPKPCVLDEDNTASLYRDDEAWTIHRKRAWTAVLSGAHYDYIDFSIIVGRENGTEESRRTIRTWMRNLTEFAHSLDLVRARPNTEWLHLEVAHALVTGLAVPGEEYAAYIADQRERTEPDAGSPLSGRATLALPPGDYLISTYSPVSGLASPALPLRGGQPATVELPAVVHDIVLLARRRPRGGGGERRRPGEAVPAEGGRPEAML